MITNNGIHKWIARAGDHNGTVFECGYCGVVYEPDSFKVPATTGCNSKSAMVAIPRDQAPLEYRGLAPYDPDYGDYTKCKHCDHDYVRHFDPYEGYRPVGCKYCECMEFVAPDS